MCEAEGAAVRSVQKWNCAHRKIIPRSNAEMRMRCMLACMYLVRRSLGANGCRVKRSWWRLAGGPVAGARKDAHGALRRGRFVVRSIRCQVSMEKFLKKSDGGGFANRDYAVFERHACCTVIFRSSC